MKPFLKPISFFFFLSLAAGILAGNVSADHIPLVLFAVFFLSVFLVLVFFLKKDLFFFVMICLFFCIGFLSIQKRVYPHLPDHHISKIPYLKKIIITGKVVSFAKHYEKKSNITLLCRTIKTGNSREKQITGRISLNIYGARTNGPSFGDYIVFESAIRPIRNFMNPGAFDYERFLRLKGIYGTAYTDIKDIKILTQKNQIGFFERVMQKIEKQRTRFYYFILEHTAGSDAGKILASLVTGKKEVLGQDIRDLFSKAGISHILAISGLHLSIIGALFFYLFYRGLSFFPILLISARARKIAGILTLVPLLGYCVFSGFSPSTQRAYIMAIVLLTSFFCEKEHDIPSSLSIAGCFILLADAAALFSISFQLSFVAVVFIVCGVSLFKGVSLKIKTRVFHKIMLMAAVTFFAGLGTGPLTAHYFHLVSHVQLISNLIAIPVMGFIVLPLGLLALLCSSLFPWFASLLVKGCSILVAFCISVANDFVSIPFSWSRTLAVNWIDIAAAYFLFAAVFFILKKRKKLSVGLVTMAMILTAIHFLNNWAEKKPDSTLAITVLDVGQGNSALIQTPGGKAILVDGGGFTGSSSFDTGRSIIAPFLWQKKIQTLEAVILTHPESDHLNGLIFVLENFDVHALIKNSDIKNSVAYAALINTCKKKNIPIRISVLQENPLVFGKVRMIFYDSNGDFPSLDFNDRCLVFKVVYDAFSMLFPGDILKQREIILSSRYPYDLQSDILLSPHHGSATSSSKLFLDKVQPKSVIISCGWHNKYGFPHHEVVKRYAQRGENIFQTNEDGAIFIISDGKDHTILTFKGR